MQSIAWGAPAEFSQNPAKLTQFFRYTLGAPEAVAGPLPLVGCPCRGVHPRRSTQPWIGTLPPTPADTRAPQTCRQPGGPPPTTAKLLVYSDHARVIVIVPTGG